MLRPHLVVLITCGAAITSVGSVSEGDHRGFTSADIPLTNPSRFHLPNIRATSDPVRYRSTAGLLTPDLDLF